MQYLQGGGLIHLHTLGRTAASRDGVPLRELPSRPDAYALLAYLCVEGPSSRIRLASLWPGDQEEGERALEEAVRVVREVAGEEVLVEEPGHLRCAEGAVQCDAGRMEDAAADGDWVTVDRLDRGPFLADLPLAEGGWRQWRDSTAAHMERLGRHASSELRAAGEPPERGPGVSSGSWTRRLLNQLRARDVFQVAAIYVAAVWVGLQAIDMLIERELLPEWVFLTCLVIGAAGLVMVVSVAWLQESEPLLDADADFRGPQWVRQTTTRRLLVGLGAAALLLLAAFLVLRSTLPGDPSGVSQADLHEIAVLYFDDHSLDQDLQPIAAGFTDELIHHLTQVPVLEVPSRNAVKRYRDGEVGLDSLLVLLDVGAYVEGALSRAGDSLRVTAQLIEVSTRRHVESTTLTAPMDDVLALRDELAEEVARILRRRLGAEIRIRERRADASSQEAWVLVQRAERRRDDAEDLMRTNQDAARRALQQADSLLARAETHDPDWVTPVILRGWTAAKRALVETELPGNFHPRWGRVALEHAERAVAMSDGHPRALELRGRIRFELGEVLQSEEADTLYADAERDLEAAVEADSTLARAWVTLSHRYHRQGRFAQARRAAERALRADYYLREAPEVTFRLWDVALNLEDRQTAERWCEDGRRRWPDQARFAQCRIFNLISFSDDPDAVRRGWAAVDTMVSLTVDAQKQVMRRHGTMWVGQIAAGSGLPDSARAIIRQARGVEPVAAMAYNEAHARLLMGQEERAVDLLELHVRDFPHRGGDFLAADWWFRDLRGHPRFQRLVEEGPPARGSGGGSQTSG